MVRVVVILAAGVAVGCGGLVQAQGTTDEGGSEATGVGTTTDTAPGDGDTSSTSAAPDGTTTDGGAVADSSDGQATTEGSSSEGGASSSGGSGGGPASCGDGRPDPPEACDDANRSEIDGCTSTCEVGPVGLSLGQASTTEEDGGNGTNIVQFSDDCPAGQVLTGLTGRLTSQGLGSAVVLGRIQGECSSLSLLDANPTEIQSAPGASLDEHGGFQEGGDWALECPEGSVITELDGDAGAIIDSLVATCVPLQVSGTGDQQELQLGAATTDGPVGGNGGDPFDAIACPNGEIASGLAGDTNSYVIRLALRCRSIALDF